MERTKLFKKYSKHPKHTYELKDTMKYKDDTGRTPDIAFIYSGRDRGKSFEITTQCLADAWYDDKQLAYIRRHEDTQQMIQEYFEDKHAFISDMTDGSSDRIIVSRSILYFAHYDQETDKVVKDKELGKFFALSTAGRYKSLQYPKIKNLVFEEVLTNEEPFLPGEANKLYNLYSTISRSDPETKMYLISNLVSPSNPYSDAWGIHFFNSKPGDVSLTKLYLGAYDEKGEEKYFLIAGHYLENRNDLSKEDLKANKRNRIRTGVASNKWDEINLYPVMDLNFIRQYNIEDTVIFEYDDLMFQLDIVEVPINIKQLYEYQEEDYKPKEETMYIGYIRKKTTEPFEGTRLYTNNPERLSPYATKGFKMVYKIDKVIDYLKYTGRLVGCTNLIMNTFDEVFAKLKLTK